MPDNYSWRRLRASSAARPSATAPSLSTVRASSVRDNSVRVSPVLKRRPRSQPSVRAPSATAPSSSAVLRHGGFGLPPTSPSPADLTRHRTRVVTVTLAVASRGCPRLLHELCDPDVIGRGYGGGGPCAFAWLR
ncbi:hypothetical protein SORBI_3008G048933 [Sorghum bicolor]|uniref:Uncharacterized protein n=1 Tax=Sorghum bicolor TaxID=4558 RepID=A0A1Z5R4Z9_SORBI|nr:hypothetical protein SORBI_3008G048933 [Sorghum bicolor]